MHKKAKRPAGPDSGALQRLSDRSRQLEGVLTAGLIAAEAGGLEGEPHAAFMEVALELAGDVRTLVEDV